MQSWWVAVFVPIVVALFGSTWVGDLLQKRRQGKATTDEIMDKLTTIDDRVTSVEDRIDLNNAITARVRIVRFNDEILEKKPHSKESFDQCLSDIDTYEDYCLEHKEFKNNKTVMSIENIKSVYKECLEDNSFLKAYK